jgi:hypothetical protein
MKCEFERVLELGETFSIDAFGCRRPSTPICQFRATHDAWCFAPALIPALQTEPSPHFCIGIFAVIEE